jgi:hypothetical protein
LQVLQTTTAALIDLPVEMTHYRDFFQWRSRNVPGYKALYEQFAMTVNEAARQSAGTRFVDCNRVAQLRVLERSLRAGNAAGRLACVRAGLFDRPWLQYDRYIVREVFDLFARTDAWIKLGYETWPGEHRGLYSYTQAPDPGGDPHDGSHHTESREGLP